MKKYIYTVLSAGILLTSMASCDSKSDLAKKVEGTWAGTPERLIDTEVTAATIIKTMEFQRDESKDSGNLIMSGLMSLTTQLEPNSSVSAQPVTMTASGIASIEGTWVAEDDDELAIVLDYNTLKVDVDTSAVVLTTNILTGADTPSLGSVKPVLAAQIQQQMKREVETQFFNARKINDIKIRDNIMSCEINGRDLTMRKQNLQ